MFTILRIDLQMTKVLADGDVKLAESNVVSEYLDAAYPEAGTKLFPADPVKLAKVLTKAQTILQVFLMSNLDIYHMSELPGNLHFHASQRLSVTC